jgi:hypothetical protein
VTYQQRRVGRLKEPKDGPLLSDRLLVNTVYSANFLFDSGCQFYGVVNARVVRRQNWDSEWYDKPRDVLSFNETIVPGVLGLARAKLDIQGWVHSPTLFIVSGSAGYDGILGAGWMEEQRAVPVAENRTVEIRREGQTVHTIYASDKLP